jgi:hypothetical protein
MDATIRVPIGRTFNWYESCVAHDILQEAAVSTRL